MINENDDNIVQVDQDTLTLILESQETNNEQTQAILEYLQRKEKQEAVDREQAEAKAKLEAEEQAKKEKEQAKKSEQQAKEQQSKAETQEARELTQEQVLSEIHDYIDLNNHIMSGQIAFIGVILGVVLMKIFWDRFHI